MWQRATSPTRASSTRPALRCISRPARHTARTPLRMDASFSSSGRNAPRRRPPISPISSSQPKKQPSYMAALAFGGLNGGRRSQAGDDRHDPKGDDDPRGGQNRSPSPSPQDERG